VRKGNGPPTPPKKKKKKEKVKEHREFFWINLRRLMVS
jgi:hypothetical protein